MELTLPGRPPLTTRLSRTGYFRLTVPLPAASPAELDIGDDFTDVWLAPGDDLTLTVDAQDFAATLGYTGSGARPNRLLADEGKHREAADSVGAMAAKGRSPVAFAGFVDSLHTAATARLAAALPGPRTPGETAFVAWQTRETAYRLAAARAYFGFHRQLAFTDPYYAFLTDSATPPLDNPAAVSSHAYREFVEGALLHYGGAADPTRLRFAGPCREGARRLSPVVERAVLPRFVLLGLDSSPAFADADSLRRFALDSLPLASADRARINTAWARRQLTRAGRPAPAFAATDTAGRRFDWGSVRGKLVYLDFWASWCHPCLEEMPGAARLHAALQDRAADVVFLNVSVDHSAVAWRQTISKYHVGGYNLRAGGSIDSPALRAYGASGVPRYLLIGPDGRILDGNAPRPSRGAEAAIRAALAALKP